MVTDAEVRGFEKEPWNCFPACARQEYTQSSSIFWLIRWRMSESLETYELCMHQLVNSLTFNSKCIPRVVKEACSSHAGDSDVDKTTTKR